MDTDEAGEVFLDPEGTADGDWDLELTLPSGVSGSSAGKSALGWSSTSSGAAVKF